MTDNLATVGPEGYGVYDVKWDGNQPSLRPSSKEPDGYLVPGFVDIHFHGAFGIDLMAATSDDLTRLCDSLKAYGYESVVLTTITASAKDVAKALSQVPPHPMIEGIHIEGPFISDTYPGAQPVDAIMAMRDAGPEWKAVFEDPLVTIVTLAPDNPGSLEAIPGLVANGILVSLGHTNATMEQAAEAFSRGATNVTHTFNAMRGLHHREPGILGAALTDDHVTCELIYDKHHVDRAAAEILLRCKGLDAVVAVSDSSAATGMPDGTELKMWGHDCLVSGQTVRLQSNGSLAGSAVTLLDCFQNLASDFGAEAAIRACSLNPSRLLGKSPNSASVWVRFDNGLELTDIYRSEA